MADTNTTHAAVPTGKRQRIEAQTATQRAHAEPPTELVDPVALAATELAWSRADDAPDYTDWVDGDTVPVDDGRRPIPVALVILLLGVVVSAVALAFLAMGLRSEVTAPRPTLDGSPMVVPGWVSTPPAPESAPASAPAQSAPAAAAQTPSAAPPEPPAQHVETDDEFFERSITTGGSNPPITDMTAAKAQAHALCTYLEASPRTQSDLYQYTRDVWPTWTARQSGSFVGSAIDAYCGQYINLPD